MLHTTLHGGLSEGRINLKKRVPWELLALKLTECQTICYNRAEPCVRGMAPGMLSFSARQLVCRTLTGADCVTS